MARKEDILLKDAEILKLKLELQTIKTEFNITETALKILLNEKYFLESDTTIMKYSLENYVRTNTRTYKEKARQFLFNEIKPKEINCEQ